jgi:1-acyl-sn-glycerol-3-phosphate acyltransferase
VPTPNASLLSRVAASALRLFGWRAVLVEPPGPKGLIVVYPHTSNWDFPIGILYKAAVRLPIRWMGKDTLFRWPFRGLMRRLGGIPVNRRAQTGFVEEMVAEFGRHEWMWLVLAPEGTRSRTEYWKSGFYRIALAGRLPLGLGFIDYATRRVGVDTYLELSGDEDADLARIRAYYADKHGLRPAQAGEIRLRR